MYSNAEKNLFTRLFLAMETATEIQIVKGYLQSTFTIIRLVAYLSGRNVLVKSKPRVP
jgi:hypothetical protein